MFSRLQYLQRRTKEKTDKDKELVTTQNRKEVGRSQSQNKTPIGRNLSLETLSPVSGKKGKK